IRCELPAAQNPSARSAGDIWLALSKRQLIANCGDERVSAIEVRHRLVLRELTRNVESQAAVAVAGLDAHSLRPPVGNGHEKSLRDPFRAIGVVRIVSLGGHRQQEAAWDADSEWSKRGASRCSRARD